MEETGVTGENHRPVASHWQTFSHNVLLSTPPHELGSNSTLTVIGTDCTGSWKSNYHTITTTTVQTELCDNYLPIIVWRYIFFLPVILKHQFLQLHQRNLFPDIIYSTKQKKIKNFVFLVLFFSLKTMHNGNSHFFRLFTQYYTITMETKMEECVHRTGMPPLPDQVNKSIWQGCHHFLLK